MLEARNVTLKVAEKELVSDISLSFGQSKLYLIIGPNGAGKTSLIKVLARLLRPQVGTVSYDGRDVANATDADLAKRRAVLSQAIEIAFPLTVREMVMMGRYPHFGGRPGGLDEKIVDETMELFDVMEFGGRNYQTLSGGERQRVNFARVLAQLWRPSQPEAIGAIGLPRTSRYLFLDEPLTFLDIGHQIGFMKSIREFTRSANTVTIGVVHDLNLAARFADEIILLNDGKVVAQGTAEEVLTENILQNVFGVKPRFVNVDGVGLHIIFE
jgi:iron complex transport system ATP-binding protein